MTSLRCCEKCKVESTLWWKNTPTGFLCNPCYKKQWYLKNRKSEPKPKMTEEQRKAGRIAARRKYDKNNADKKIAYQNSRKAEKAVYDKQYRELNKERLRQKQKEKLATDIQFKLSVKLRGRIKDAMRDSLLGKRKAGSAVKDLGCTVEFLKQYLESKFQEGMSWDNYGYHGWHIDHIKPLCKFNLTIESEFKEACHYTNLQPLWAKDNLSKGGYYEA